MVKCQHYYKVIPFFRRSLSSDGDQMVLNYGMIYMFMHVKVHVHICPMCINGYGILQVSLCTEGLILALSVWITRVGQKQHM